MAEREKTVSRVLVMIELPDGQSPVYDLTELVLSAAPSAKYSHADVTLKVKAEKSWRDEDPPFQLKISWSSDFGEYSPQCAELTDAVNFGMPDNLTVENLRKRAKRLRKKAESLDWDAKVAKLDHVASLRGQHPIAVVTTTAPHLEAKA